MANDELVKVTGIDEVQALLSSAPTRLVRNAFARALAAACVPIVKELDIRTPVLTGLTKAALTSDIAVNSEGKGGIGRVGFGKQGYKARLVETGHRMVGHKPGLKDLGKPVPPHPFMAQAADASADAAIGAFADSLVESLKADI